jgi:hypothetical protein
MRRNHRIGLVAALWALVALCLTVVAGVGFAKSSASAGQYQYGKKVTICHKGKVTIRISRSALPAHKAHGDKEGPCSSSAKRKAKANKAKAKANAEKAKKDGAKAEAKADKAEAKEEAKAEKSKGKSEKKAEKAEAKVDKAEAKADKTEAKAEADESHEDGHGRSGEDHGKGQGGEQPNNSKGKKK